MKITKEWLNEKSACSEGLEWFNSRFPEGGEYQIVLNALAEDGQEGHADWLMSKAGPTKDVLEVESWSGKRLFFAGTIRAAKGLAAEKSIKAGLGIKAGSGIKAGLGIEAGEDYEIWAGLSVRLSAKTRFAIIIAKTKPKNIGAGVWHEDLAAV